MHPFKRTLWKIRTFSVSFLLTLLLCGSVTAIYHIDRICRDVSGEEQGELFSFGIRGEQLHLTMFSQQHVISLSPLEGAAHVSRILYPALPYPAKLARAAGQLTRETLRSLP